MKSTLALFFTLFALTTSCSRQENPDKWVELLQDRNNTYYYTFDKMAKSDRRLVKIWVKTVFREKRHSDEGDISYVKNLYMIKCDEKKVKINPGVYYSPSNEIVSKTDTDQQDTLLQPSNKTTGTSSFKLYTSEQDGYYPIFQQSPAYNLYGIVCR